MLNFLFVVTGIIPYIIIRDVSRSTCGHQEFVVTTLRTSSASVVTIIRKFVVTELVQEVCGHRPGSRFVVTNFLVQIQFLN